MKVKALSNINSGQYVAGDIAEFPDEEARLLIESKAAEPYVDEKPAEQSADGFPQHEQQPAQPQAPTPPAAPPQPAPAPQPQPAAPPAPTQPQGGQPTPEEVAAAAAMAE